MDGPFSDGAQMYRRPAVPPAADPYTPYNPSNYQAVPSSSAASISASAPHGSYPQQHVRQPLSDADRKLTGRKPGSGGRWNYGNASYDYTRNGDVLRKEWKWIVGIVVVALWVRLWHLSWPSSVVFDEVHFGGFARKYIKQTFFMDVHPPLAKLLITLAALIGRFDGDFDFKDIGKDYLEAKVPYVTMRFLPAIMGVAVVPLAYLTLRGLGTKRTTALLGAGLVTFENALITQSRLILLDSPLIFFTAITTYFWVRFSNEDYAGQPFSKNWWTTLFLTGLGLGAVVSCKWVGLFTIATIGLSTIRQLWLLLGNLKVTPRVWFRHFFARALCLIVVPTLFYMFMFQIHFWVLNRSGDGDGFMSSEFQHTLIGHGMEDTYADVALGSHITLKHVNTQGGYLHSHAHAYPGGSNQQQITLYPHRDENNVWRIVNASSDAGPTGYDWDHLPLQFVEDGMKVRFEHITTEKRLHSHDIRPPISEVDFQNEVSAYGFPGFAGDANDDFFVELSKETRGGRDKRLARKRVRTLRSHFRLRHVMTGCYLFSHKVKLPEWGFEQQEVTCNKNPVWDNSLWYVETNTHAQLGPGSEKVNYHKPGFMAKFLELQAVMWQTNAGLTDRHAYDSRPSSWPWLRRGINFWVKDHRQVYLIGNPFIWWMSSLAIAAYLGFRGFLVLRAQRGFKDLRNPTIQTYDEICGFLALGWALHYLPFFLMQRQLFLHHYLPALYFAILCLCAVFDMATRNIQYWKRSQLALLVLLVALYGYYHFSPLTYAQPWTRSQCSDSKWLKNWDFSCGDFLEHKTDYWSQIPQPSQIFPSQIIEQVAPEPGSNAFEKAQDGKDDKASQTSVNLDDVEARPQTTYAEGFEQPETENVEDTRVPIGRDAGAAEATGSDAAGGGAGWQGGAEDDAGIIGAKEVVESTEQKPQRPAEPVVPSMELDYEARRLVDQAMELE